MMTTISVPRWPQRVGPPQTPDRFLIHAMGEFVKSDDGHVMYAPQWIEFLGLSVHAFVTPDGRVIESFGPTIKGAHAAPFNTGSIGFELLVPGVHRRPSLREAMKGFPFPPAQLKAAAEWCGGLAGTHGINRWSTHHILVPERKVDPWMPDHPTQTVFAGMMTSEGIAYAAT